MDWISLMHELEMRQSGGEGGILSPPFFATVDEPYACAIIPSKLGTCKRIRTSVPVSIVSPGGHISQQNGISGISKPHVSLREGRNGSGK